MEKKTITLKLKLIFNNEEEKREIDKTMLSYQQACNFMSEYAFKYEKFTDRKWLDKRLYKRIRNLFNLKSQMAQSVTKTVIAKYLTEQTKLRKSPFRYKDENGEWKKVKRTLLWLQKPIYFSQSQVNLVAKRDWAYLKNSQTLSLNTINGRIKVNHTTKGFDKYFTPEWSLGEGKIIKKNNNYFFYLTATRPTIEFNKDDVKHVVGIDRGLRFLATTFDEKDKVRFFDGKEIMKKRDKYKKLRAELQSKGTKSAKRRLKELSGKENRWMTDINHQITKTLIREYGEDTLFVLEDLTNIRFNANELGKRMRESINSWSFGQFEQFLSYKAELNKSKVLKVSPRYTSQRCPKCGTIHKSNRKHKIHEYHCNNCQYRSNDDRLAAMNIQELGKRYISGEKELSFKLK